jgi:tetratricopeptide (TPR) repeat protein
MVLSNLALVHGELGDGRAALLCLARTRDMYEELDYARGIANSFNNLGRAHLAAADPDAAIESLGGALAHAHRLGDLELVAVNHHDLAGAYAMRRDFPNATTHFRRAVAVYRSVGSRRWEAIALADLGTMLIEAGHRVLARSVWLTALTILTELADPRAARIRAALGADLP